MKKYIAIALSIGVLAGLLSLVFGLPIGSSAQADGSERNIVVVLRGAAEGVMRDIDGTMMNCFDVDLVDPRTGRIVGEGTDCLDLNSITPIGDDGGFEINTTTFFHLKNGTLVSLSRTTVQPVGPGSSGVTHVTGAIPAPGTNQITDGTKGYRSAEGRVRLSGAADLSKLFTDNVITFDCIFVIDLEDGDNKVEDEDQKEDD